MKKKLLILLFLILIIFSLTSCGKNKGKKDKDKDKNGDNQTTNPDENQQGKEQNDTLIDYAKDHLPEFTKTILNVSENETFEINGKKTEIDNEAKRKNEEYILSFINGFGITEFKSPDCKSYSINETRQVAYFDGIQVNQDDYTRYLDSLFYDWKKKEQAFVIGMFTYQKIVYGKLYEIDVSFSGSTLMISFNLSLNEWNKEYIDKLEYNSTYYNEGPKNIKIEVTNKWGDRSDSAVAYLLEDEFLIDDNHLGYSDNSYYYNLKESYYYELDKNNETISEKIALTTNSDDFIRIYFVNTYNPEDCISMAFSYIFLWQLADGLNNYDNTIARYIGLSEACEYNLVDYEYIDGRRTAHLTSKSNLTYNYNDIWIDVATGIVIKEITYQYTTATMVTEHVQFEVKLSFGEFSINKEIDSQDSSKIKFSVTETYPEPSTHTVNFLDKDGEIIYTEVVSNHESVKKIPTLLDGYIGYKESLDDITSDIDIHAVYASDTYTVIFKDNLGNIIKTEVFNKYDTLAYPIVSDIKGYKKVGWSRFVTSVFSDLEIIFEYEKINTYKVKFYNYNEELIKEEDVLEGEDATAPVVPSSIGSYKFIGWSPKYEDVCKDISCYAVYENTANPYNYGSINYYVLELYSQLESLASSVEQQQYIFDLSGQLALASAAGYVTSEYLNLGEALTIIYPVPQVLNNYGVLLINNGQKQKAVDYIECAVEYDKYNFIYSTNLAELLFEDEFTEGNLDFSACLELLDFALRENPNYGPALQLKSEIYLLQGDESNALKYMIESAKYTWNELSVAEFYALYDAIEERYQSEQEKYSTVEAFAANWVSPLEDYIELLYEIGTLNSDNASYDFELDYAIEPSPSSMLTFGGDMFDFALTYAESALVYENAYDRDDRYDYDKYFYGNNYSEERKYFGDMRQFVMFMLIDQYYEQLIQLTFGADQTIYSIYDDIDNYAEKSKENLGNSIDDYERVCFAGHYTVEEKTLYAYQHGEEALRIAEDKSTIELCNFAEDAILHWDYSLVTYADQKINKILHDFYNDYLSKVGLIIENCTDKTLITHLYNKVMNRVHESYAIYYGEFYSLTMEMDHLTYVMYEGAKEMAIIDLGQAYEDEERARYEACKPDDPVPFSGKPDVAFSIQTPNFFGFSLSAELTDNSFSINADTPWRSVQIGYDTNTFSKTITTVDYGIISGINNFTLNTDTDPFKQIYGFGGSMKVGYGTTTTYDTAGHVIEHDDIIVSTASGSVGDWGGEISTTQKYDTMTAGYIYSSASLKSSYGFVSLSFNFDR